MRYFTIKELSFSLTAAKLNIVNVPDSFIKENLTALVDNVLDPLRDAFGHPISVTSGYRSDRLNIAVGGSPTSQHLLGQAADISAGSKQGNKDLFKLIQSLDLPFDQLIDEHNYSWIHVSFSNKLRRQILHL